MNIENAWVIRNQGKWWWRANSEGYTDELIAAGVYDLEEAHLIAGSRAEDCAVRLTEAIKGASRDGTVIGLIESRLAELEARLDPSVKQWAKVEGRYLEMIEGLNERVDELEKSK